MRRKLNAMILVAVLLLSVTSQIYARNTIKIGYFAEEPQVIANTTAESDAHPKGAAVDYWEKFIAPGMGVDIAWVGPLSLDRLQKMLEEGSIDAALMLAKNPERAEKFLYPNSTFYEMQPGLAVHKNNPLSVIEKVADISNMKIGYAAGAIVTPFMKDTAIQFDLVYSTDHLRTNMEKLLKGRIDAVYSMQLVTIKYQFAKYSDIKNFKFLPLPEKSNGAYTVFSKKANPDFLKGYVSVHERSKANYANILKQYVSE